MCEPVLFCYVCKWKGINQSKPINKSIFTNNICKVVIEWGEGHQQLTFLTSVTKLGGTKWELTGINDCDTQMLLC